MVDIHSHILHGLDDGPKTLDEAAAMLRLAAESGTTDIVATPHANFQYAFNPEAADQKIRELAQASGGAPRIHRGCEFHLYFENIERALADPARFTINGKRYLLVEFSDVMILDSAGDIFGRMLAAGMTPVITHPERNAMLARSLDGVGRWVAAGCRVQVTAQSFLGRFGQRAQKAVERFMERGLAHFVASDAHDAKRRAPVLAEAYQHVAGRYGERRAEALFVTNPRAVLEGGPVEATVPGAEPRAWWRW